MMTRGTGAFIALMMAFAQIKAQETLTLTDALKKKMVTAELSGKGGFTGPVMEMKLTSLSGKPLKVTLEPGLRLQCKDESMQDLVITQAVEVTLPVRSEKKLLVNAMCCTAGKKPPAPGTAFTVKGMADSSLIKLTRFIDAYGMHKNASAQHAVWVFSDNKRVEGMDITDPANKPLIEFVCKLKQTAKPEYSIEFEDEPGAAFSGRAAKVKGFFRTEVKGPCTLTMALCDASGKVIQSEQIQGPPSAGKYRFQFAFRVKGFEPGTYYGRVLLEGKVLSEVKMEL